MVNAGAIVIHHPCTCAHEQGAGPAGLSSAPNLDDFAGVLETLAQRYAVVDHSAPDWVRRSIVAAGSKLRALRFMLQHAPHGKPLRLLNVGAQIGSLPLYAMKFGIHAAAVDNAEFAQNCGSVLREYGVDYRVTLDPQAPADSRPAFSCGPDGRMETALRACARTARLANSLRTYDCR